MLTLNPPRISQELHKELLETQNRSHTHIQVEAAQRERKLKNRAKISNQKHGNTARRRMSTLPVLVDVESGAGVLGSPRQNAVQQK